VARLYLLAGNHSINFQGQSFLDDAMLVDNVKLCPQTTVTQTSKSIMAISAGYPFYYSSISNSEKTLGAPILNSTNFWCASSKKVR